MTTTATEMFLDFLGVCHFHHFLLQNTPLPLPPMSDDEIERVTVAVKVKFSEKLKKMSPKADGIFDKNDHQKPLFDDADSLSNSDGMTILQAQIIYKELNEGKLLKQLNKVFLMWKQWN